MLQLHGSVGEEGRGAELSVAAGCMQASSPAACHGRPLLSKMSRMQLQAPLNKKANHARPYLQRREAHVASGLHSTRSTERETMREGRWTGVG